MITLKSNEIINVSVKKERYNPTVKITLRVVSYKNSWLWNKLVDIT